jgi:hypothetical protein
LLPVLGHSGKKAVHPVEEDEAQPNKPVWYGVSGKRELWVGNYLIKKYTQPAKNQELVLQAFEEQNWPDRIDDPLPGVAGVNAKRRLRETVEALNDHHKTQGVLRFYMDGTGEGVTWELLRDR